MTRLRERPTHKIFSGTLCLIIFALVLLVPAFSLYASVPDSPVYDNCYGVFRYSLGGEELTENVSSGYIAGIGKESVPVSQEPAEGILFSETDDVFGFNAGIEDPESDDVSVLIDEIKDSDIGTEESCDLIAESDSASDFTDGTAEEPVSAGQAADTSDLIVEEIAESDSDSEQEKEDHRFYVRSGAGWSMGVYDFYNGHGTDGPRVFTVSDMGVSVSLEAGMEIRPDLRVYVGADGSYERKRTEDIIWPQGFAMYYAGLTAGADYVCPLDGGRFCLYGGLSAGWLRHFYSYGRSSSGGIILLYTDSASVGARVGVNWNITDSVSVGACSRVRISHLWDDDRYMRSFTFLLDPLSLSMEVAF